MQPYPGWLDALAWTLLSLAFLCALIVIVDYARRGEVPASSPVHWFMMQTGMIVGFFTSYPVNKWLIQRGGKEKMPEYV